MALLMASHVMINVAGAAVLELATWAMMMTIGFAVVGEATPWKRHRGVHYRLG